MLLQDEEKGRLLVTRRGVLPLRKRSTTSIKFIMVVRES